MTSADRPGAAIDEQGDVMENRRMVQVAMPLDNVIVCTADYGGYKQGRCAVCGETGYLDNQYGYPFGTLRNGNRLVHKRDCSFGQLLEIEIKVKLSE